MLHLARLSIRRPLAALLVWAAVAGGLTLIGLGVSDQLSPSVTTVAGTESSHAQDLAKSEFGPSVLVPILLEGPARQLDRQGPALVRALSQRKDTRVMSAWDGGEIAAGLRPKPTAALLVAAVAKSEDQMVRTTQGQIDRTVDRIVANPVHASVTGQPTIDRAMKDEAIDSARRSMALTLPILFVVLLLLLRAPVVAGALSVLGTATAFSALGVMSLLGKAIDVDAVAVTSASMLGLALGVGYGLLFYRRWRREVMEDVSHHDAAHAAVTALNTSGRSVLIGGTALIVALLIAPMIADQKILTAIGVGALLCSVFAVGAAVVVMPAFLVLAGRHSQSLSFAAPRPALRGWEHMVAGGNWVIKRAVIAGALATAALAALAIPVLSLETGPPSVKYLPAGNSARVAFERVATVMGPGYPTPYNVVVVSNSKPITDPALLAKFDAYQATLAKDRRVAAVAGPGTFNATSRQLSVLPKKLKESTALLKGGKAKLGELESGLGQASAGAAELHSKLGAAASGSGQLYSGSGQLNAGLATAQQKLGGGLSQALAGAQALKDGAAKALAGSQKISGGIGQAAKPVKAGVPIVQSMASDVAASAGAVKGAAAGSQALSAQLDQASAAIAAIPDGTEGKNAAAGAVSSAQQAASGLQSSLGATSTKLAGASGIATAFSSQVQELSGGLAELYAGSTALTAGITELQAGNAKLASGIQQLSSGANTGLAALRDGAGQIQAGLGQLSGGLSAGVAPVGQLATGLQGGYTQVGRFRQNLPSPKDLEKLQQQSPGLFQSGYFVLAAISGASATQQSQASFAVNLDRGGNAGQITVFPKQAMEDPATQELGVDLSASAARFAKATKTEAAVGGPAGSLADFRSETSSRIAPVIIITALVVGLLMMVLLRTVVLPAVAVAFDLLASAATFGILALLFTGDDPLLGGPGYLDPMSIIAIFSLIFGMTMVYEVHLLHRTREAFMQTGDPHGALRTGLRDTAAAGTGAALAMIAAVIPFAFTQVMTIRELAVGVAIAVALDAALVRPVLLPAAVEVLGRWSWWPTSWTAPPSPAATAPPPPAPAAPLAPVTPMTGNPA
jgi:RND superfamily putative drug exporter